ncbi:MAG TPA: methyltransferase domain-containing protein [Nitrososphaera sp.]|nr:methyltransferase domain-containing protein [Nitrososphaera sp.]
MKLNLLGLDTGGWSFLSIFYPRLVVELGMGDGTLLETLAKRDRNSIYIGIEVDNEQCKQAQSRIGLSNVIIVNSSFEDLVPRFQDESIDQFIAVLPDPAFIDEKKEEQWKPLYKTLYYKLKKQGCFRLVTELTDELLQPVSDDRYSVWADWLKSCFILLGFTLAYQQEGAPKQYLSRCIKQFEADPQRIRMITLDLLKH